jgi:hypothetical protein
VDAGIGDESDRAPELGIERAEVRVRIGVHAQLLAERLGIESPPLGVCRLAGEAAEARQVHELALERDLEVVARRRLVQVERLQCPARPRLEIVGVDVEDAETGAVLRRRLVLAPRRRRGAKGLDRSDLEIGPGPDREQPGQERVDPAAEAAVRAEELFLAREIHGRVLFQRLEEGREGALEA